MASGVANGIASKVLNQLTPTGTSGAPGSFGTALGGSAMKVRLHSTTSSASAAGTEIASGGGYTTGGTAVPAASSTSSGGSTVTAPASSALTWTNSSGSSWTIASVEVTDSAGTRVWWGAPTGAPITIANGNTFRLDVASLVFSAS